MADKLFALTSDQQQRVGRVVQDFERRTPTRNGGVTATSRPTASFWAELTGAGSSGDGWYSWKLIYPDPTATSGWKDASPAVTGTSNARESSDTPGLYSSDTPRRVLMRYVGLDGDGNPVYVFSATAGMPSGLLRYTVLQMLDDVGTIGWDYPRFH